MEIIYVLIGLQIKHFIIDFPLQNEWQWRNKGNLFHAGGHFHAFIHVVGTLLVIMVARILNIDFNLDNFFYICLFEYLAHYLIDYTKINVNKKFNWHPHTPQFYNSLGADQALHQFCYLIIVAMAYKGIYL